MIGVDVRNLALGPGEDGKTIAPEGVKASSFTPPQRAQLLDLVGEWVRILDDAPAGTKMAEVKSSLDDTYFAWAGATTNGSQVYFRIQGPAVFIEYATQGKGTDHIHTIFRDPNNDYAAKVTTRAQFGWTLLGGAMLGSLIRLRRSGPRGSQRNA